ncbi:hypothetical protein AB0C07_18400 [Actinoplanes missouriensis]|uniref:hypothetical protein n=1 Tax=Actinoplanes missouriensis TaxID=1866 RepID=UPI0033CC019D
MGTPEPAGRSGVESFRHRLEYVLLAALVIAGLIVCATDLRGDIVALVNGLTT